MGAMEDRIDLRSRDGGQNYSEGMSFSAVGEHTSARTIM